MILTGQSPIFIRPATRADLGVILEFIKGLAEYERLPHEVVATTEGLDAELFSSHPSAEVLLAFDGEEPVGFALFFHNFSTFLGRKGLYLEDLYVIPEHRGKGVGKTLLRRLAQIAVDRNCGRFEWAVLDWNETAIGFYKSIGAVPMDDWTVYRLSGEPLHQLADVSSDTS